jgi:pimeloyl-ACP methyl ester carboxylesterase
VEPALFRDVCGISTEEVKDKMEKRVMILVPGIHMTPRDWKNWIYRFEGHYQTMDHSTNIKCAVRPYRENSIVRGRSIERIASGLAKCARHYLQADYQVSLVGHSNGTQVIQYAFAGTSTNSDDLIYMMQAENKHIHAVHLFSGAMIGEIEDTRLGGFFSAEYIEHLFIYNAGKDKALRWAKWTPFFGGFGKDTLGRRDINELKNYVGNRGYAQNWPEYGHSTFFDADRWIPTADMVLYNDNGHYKKAA